MKKKIAILGSTGSIGKSTLEVVRKDIENFEVILLMVNKDIVELIKQVKEFNVKNIVVNDIKKFVKISKILINKKINIFNNINDFLNFYKKKLIIR